MKKLILAIILSLISIPSFAMTKQQMCVDKSTFVYYIGAARDKKMSKQDYLTRLNKIINEVGVAPDEADEMRKAVDIVYGNSQLPKEYLAEKYYNYCMSLIQS